MTEPVKSPCIQVCIMDRETGFCLGCHRTMEELVAWREMSDADRSALVAELPSREKLIDPAALAKVSWARRP
jgi:predicted Fe-S protein YdhL (DUF1289 family)